MTEENHGPARRRPDKTPDDRMDTNRPSPIPRGESRDFPGISGDFRIDILDHEDEVIVVAELPGAEEDAIKIRLLDPQTLRITARRTESVGEGYYIRERGGSTLSRLIRLPASVTREGAKTSFRNGVIEMRLTKMLIDDRGSGGREIPIE